MSDESLHRSRGRPLRDEERALLRHLLSASSLSIVPQELLAEDMSDGGMGSIRFASTSAHRMLGRSIAEGEYVDSDGMMVSIVVNVDKNNDLYELDFWKVDFSPLRRYPTPEEVTLKRHID